MPYVTSFERLAKEEGREEGRREGNLRAVQEDITEALTIRFGSVPAGVSVKLLELSDLATLKRLLRQAITTPSLGAFEQALAQ